MTGILKEIRIYKENGKLPVCAQKADTLAYRGLRGDLHCMDEGKQISIIRSELLTWMQNQPLKGLCFDKFCANLIITGLEPQNLGAGSVLEIGGASFLIMESKKRCFPDECPLCAAGKPCALRYSFAKCIRSGEIQAGDCVSVSAVYKHPLEQDTKARRNLDTEKQEKVKPLLV